MAYYYVTIILTLIGYFIAFLVGILMIRALFIVPQFLRIKKAKLKILSEMAIQNGVEPDKIMDIINEADL
ncbi:hypothetical protein BDD43_0607 [Mucilaginibacter gracilis]|uniref:Uncharacterized protein n=2 Tax=Mucilaginibacter TaxID=423349 RepID=H1YIM6_9SPHI|nr:MULTISPECIES: hypothetical protein [Mucilaginibacter]EHQ26592.1 hypothetical protein Mucpa_2471 [Mucilaginibacter paludis DSM 18603]RKR80488.1 hypothetical protein BDD43_0607 [Mucilaginibacter gracilis]